MESNSDLEVYESLREEVKSILIERSFRARWELAASRWEVGQAIVRHPAYEDRQGQTGSVLLRLGRDLGIGRNNLYLAVQAYKRWPYEDFSTVVDKLGLGKHEVSWRHIRGLIPEAAQVEEASAAPAPGAGGQQIRRAWVTEYSRGRIGQVWTAADHERLVRGMETETPPGGEPEGG